MTGETGSRGFRAGSWLVVPSGGQARAYRLSDGAELELTGELSGVLRSEPSALRTLGQLGGMVPEARELREALADSAPEPLTVGGALRGNGWGTLFIELTSQCNEACIHCYAEAHPQGGEELTQQEVLEVVREAARLGFQRVQFTGGDPLVSKTYMAGIRMARELGVPQIEVFTNGLALSEGVADELAALEVDLALSFYSHRPEVHDAITQTPGSQERTLRAIDRGIRRGMRVRVGLIAMEANRADLPATVALLAEHGIPRSALGMDQEREVGRGTFRDGDSASAAISDQAAAGELPRQGQPDAQESRSGGAVDDGGAGHGGIAGNGKLCVSYTGEVYPCIFNRSRPLGSIRGASLQAVLDGALTPKAGVLPIAERRTELACPDCRCADRLLSQLVLPLV